MRLTLQLQDLEFGHYSKRSFGNDSTSNIMNVCFIDSSWIQLIYLIRRMKVAKTHYSLINCRMLQQRKPITNRSLNLDSVWALSSVLVLNQKTLWFKEQGIGAEGDSAPVAQCDWWHNRMIDWRSIVSSSFTTSEKKYEGENSSKHY